MTTKEIRVQLALGTLSRRAKIKLAMTKRTSKEILTMLATDVHYDVRYYAAKNPNTSKEVLVKLSADKNWSVRWRVAKNPNTPIDVLKKLSKDGNSDVSHSVPHTLNMVDK